MLKRNPSISVFFPCYNDSKTIGKLVEDAFKILQALTDDYEVIVIDDGSMDESGEILKKLSKKYKHLKIISHLKNKGYGGALKSGFNAVSKSLVFYTDGDGQYDVKELPLLVSLLTPNVNFINGIKMERKDATYRVFFGNLHKFLTRWLFWLPVYDVDCDFRLIRTDLIKKLNLKSNSGSICVELVKKAEREGAKFRQVSVHHYERKFGKSQFFRPRQLLFTLLDLIHLWIQLIIVDGINKHW